MKNLIIIILLLCAPLHSQAGIWIHTASQFWSESSDETPKNLWNTSSTVGFRFIQGFLLGAQNVTYTDQSTDRFTFGLGPKVGFLHNGIEISGSYIAYTRQKKTTETLSGKGFALNLGWTFELAGPFRIGLHTTYLKLTFDRSGSNFTEKHFTPQIAFAVEL